MGSPSGNIYKYLIMNCLGCEGVKFRESFHYFFELRKDVCLTLPWLLLELSCQAHIFKIGMPNNMIHTYSKEDKVLLAVDCIIFGFDGDVLKVLLIKRDFEPEKGKWSLVGGFLKQDENLEKAAARILKHYTGLNDIFMEQVATFSEVNRDPAERTISTAYYALINIQDHNDKLNRQYSADWFNVSLPPTLIFDHAEMVRRAILQLRHRAASRAIGFELLPDKFTMRQLQNLYEAIWDQAIDKRNFISKIRGLKILEKLNEKDKTSSRKGSFLYRFKAGGRDQQFWLKF